MELCSYEGPPIRVFTRPQTVERHLRYRGGFSVRDRKYARAWRGWSVRYRRHSAVYVNVARHATLEELADTAAHEVVHLRFPSLPHGAVFEARVRALLDGARCGRRGTRLPERFHGPRRRVASELRRRGS